MPALLLLLLSVTNAQSLGHYNIDPDGITISGVSSGGFMASQMQVAFSNTIHGAGMVAGGIYWCAQGNAKRAQTVCMNQPEQVKVEEHIAHAQQLAAAGSIDPLQNLTSHRIYLFASPKDLIIKPMHGDKLAEFYTGLGASIAKFEKTLASAHGFPTLNYGAACELGFSPWLLNCGFDGAGEILRAMYPSAALTRGTAVSEHLHKFLQEEFGANGGALIYKEGYVYVPSACEDATKTCRLHIALHGCQMNPEDIQEKFVRLAGYNEWAEANAIIVLYPQAAKRRGDNPYGCWDWFGFTGAGYETKAGVQMAALGAMIGRVSGR